MTRFVKHLLSLVLGTAALAGCCLVDEDTRDCETEYYLDYELLMITNLNTEIDTRLGQEADVEIAKALRNYLKEVFTDYAHDVDLSFYDVVRDEVEEDSLRLHHETHVMDASQSSYMLYIPIRDYMHLAVANIEDNRTIDIEDGNLCHKSRLAQNVRDTVSCHNTGIFSARLPMNIRKDVSQSFEVNLYMANCAAAIVIDTVGSNISDVKVFATGFATEFNICDSTYLFPYTPIVKADEVKIPEGGSLCFSTVTFPSRDPENTKAVIETDDPFVSDKYSEALWRYRVYTVTKDGTITETLLGITTPLRAGQLKIIRGKVLDNGAVQPDDPTVGVSVALDWEPGYHHEIEL